MSFWEVDYVTFLLREEAFRMSVRPMDIFRSFLPQVYGRILSLKPNPPTSMSLYLKLMSGRIPRLLSLVLAVGLLAYAPGCDSSEPEEDVGTVVGIVTMPDGETPVTGATVTLASAQMFARQPGSPLAVAENAPSTLTDSEGRFRLEGVPEGEQQLIARRGVFSVTFPVSVIPGQTVEVEPQAAAPEAPMATILGAFDAMHEVASEIGLVMEEDIVVVQPTVFDDFAEAQQYAMIFVNCATTLGNDPQRLENARRFVEEGGVLYFSDLSGATVDLMVEGFSGTSSGTPSQVVEGSVMHEDLATWLEGRVADPNQVEIVYNLSGWRRIVEMPEGGIELLRGTRVGAGEAEPLAAMFPMGSGALVYTTFHNTTDLPDEQREVLRYFLFVHTGVAA